MFVLAPQETLGYNCHMNLKKRIRALNVVIALHEYTQLGPGHDLRQFLLEKAINNLLFITHPLLYDKESYQKSSGCKFYIHGQFFHQTNARHWRLPEPFLYVKDFLYTLFWVFSQKVHQNLFVGLDPLNALSGIALKQAGFVDKVVYYSIDYFPRRFKNPLMNKIYHLGDRLAVRFSDETWNVGARMAQARKEYGNMRSNDYARQYVLPIGVWLSNVKRESNFDSHKLVFAGHLLDHMGVDLAIKALPLIIKHAPNASLQIIGRGPVEEELRRFSRDLGIERNVTFSGWIEKRQEFIKELSGSAIGVATFNTKILDDKVRNADPGKIKDYMVAGLPVIVTRAIFNYDKIQRTLCGVVIDYNTHEFASAVLKLMNNPPLLRKYKKNALLYVSQFDWELLFTKALLRLLAK